MDILGNLGLGLAVVLSWQNLGYCFAGVLLGTAVGVLPGVGPVVTIALLLPLTFGIPAVSAIILLAGIYYGAQYGSSTTAILLKVPGEASSVVTCIDGHAMARKGQAGTALGISAVGSFVAGILGTLVIALFSPLLTSVALKFGPADNFALMAFGLVGAAVLARGSPVKAVAMVLCGLALGLVGTDVNTNDARLTFGIVDLSGGLDFVVLSMGLVGVSEIIANLHQKDETGLISRKIGRVWPDRRALATSWKAILRGTGLGSILGVLPGGGPSLAAFTAYSLEKKLSRHPQGFGHGAIEGVAAPESANNAAAQTAFVPLLTLGLPSSPTMALMAGALTIQGIVPGPQIASERPELFWGVVASMLVGNVMLLALNLPLIGIWVRMVQLPYRLLYPAILLFCAVGVYSLEGSGFDVLLTAVFGVVGYLLIKLDFDPVPLLLGFVLGPMMEENFRRALLLTQGDPVVFVTRPISAGFLAATLILVAILLLPAVRRGREIVFQE